MMADFGSLKALFSLRFLGFRYLSYPACELVLIGLSLVIGFHLVDL